jgi:hypothetical protein
MHNRLLLAMKCSCGLPRSVICQHISDMLQTRSCCPSCDAHLEHWLVSPLLPWPHQQPLAWLQLLHLLIAADVC